MKLKAPVKPNATPKPPKAEAPPPDNPRRHPGSMPTSLNAAPIGMSDERRELYKQFQEGVDTGEITPASEGEEDTRPGSENPDASPEEEATETPTDSGEKETEESKPEDKTEDKEETPPSGKKEEKHTMVPHAALHEERESHKETKERLNKAIALIENNQRQINILMDEKQKLKGTPTVEEEKDDEPIEDIDVAFKTLRKENRALMERLNRVEQTESEREEAQSIRKLDAATKMVEDELTKEGFPGFSEFRPLVASAIEAEAQGNPAVISRLDNPVGWAKVYKEKVFPKVSSVFGSKTKADKIKEKEELKGKGNLVDKAGQAPVKAADEKPKSWGLTDYFKMRQEKRPS